MKFCNKIKYTFAQILFKIFFRAASRTKTTKFLIANRGQRTRLGVGTRSTSVCRRLVVPRSLGSDSTTSFLFMNYNPQP